MKINLAWEGSNVTGRVNHAPADIYSSLLPAFDHAGTFHPNGDFPPPPGFDYVRDPAQYENYVWWYPFPVEESSRIAGYVSFYNEKVDIVVDGIEQGRPKTVFS